jgi:translocator protein
MCLNILHICTSSEGPGQINQGAAADLSAWLKLIVSILACLAAGGIGSLFTFKAIPTWYRSLKKPRYTPPNWAFGPVWTILYVLMGISVFLVWDRGLATKGATLAFTLFWCQLAVNMVWSIVFFGMKASGGGVVIIIALWLLIMATALASSQVSAWAAGLLIPYLAWVSVASYLNIGTWLLNKAPQA